MGNRIAKLTEVSGEYIGHVVYQSTSMAMFSPIFDNVDEEINYLNARIFAEALLHVFPNWSDSNLESLAGHVAALTQTRYSKPNGEPDTEQIMLVADDDAIVKTLSFSAVRSNNKAVQS